MNRRHAILWVFSGAFPLACGETGVMNAATLPGDAARAGDSGGTSPGDAPWWAAALSARLDARRPVELASLPDAVSPPPPDAAPPPPDAAPPPPDASPPPPDAAPPLPPDAAPPLVPGAVIGAMYHHWWVPGRWQGDRGNYRYEPVLGHYESDDREVIRQHIAWARSAGINTFVLDAWITDRDWDWVDRNTRAVMDEADAAGLQYFILVDGWFEYAGADDGFDSQGIAAKVNARFGEWVNRPGYLRVDGRPVLFFWASWGHTCHLFELIRAGIEGTLGPIYMTGNTGDDGNRCFDRVMEYNSYTGESSDYDDQINRQDRLFRGWRNDGRPWAPTAIPGYDDTHVREGNPPVPLDPEFFRRSLQTALRYDQLAEPPMLFVCSWNEWHEGSNIEPSRDFAEPEIFLRVMHDELAAAGWIGR